MRLEGQGPRILNLFQCLKLTDEINLARADGFPRMTLSVLQMNMSDAARIQLVPSLGEGLFARFVAVSRIPDMHQALVGNSFEQFGRLRARRRVARELVFD